MIAIEYDRYGPPDVLRTVEQSSVEPGPGEVLVRLAAASVAPIDWKLRAGILREHFALRFPKVPGRDGAGTVSAVGPGVEALRVGDRVCVMAPPNAFGSYTQMRLCRVDDCVAMPDGLDFVQAASLVNAGLSAWICAVTVAKVEPGMRVLVQGGSGAVGGILVQLLRHLGAHVTATARAANREHVLALGADEVIAYDKEDFGRLRDQDVVFDLVGGETHARSYPTLRKGGHLVYLVAAPIVDQGESFGVRVTRAPIADAPEPVSGILALAGQGVIRPQVSRALPLAESAEAHRLMEAGAITQGRLVLDTR